MLELQKATKQILNNSCQYVTNYDPQSYDNDSSELNQKLVKLCLDNTTRDVNGRLVMPLLWNSKISHLLGQNYNLSYTILMSNLKKLKENSKFLQLMDETLKEQENLGIIERIDNLEQFKLDYPKHSFLPHMGIFKLDR